MPVVAVLGATGRLGSKVAHGFADRKDYELVLLTRGKPNVFMTLSKRLPTKANQDIAPALSPAVGCSLIPNYQQASKKDQLKQLEAKGAKVVTVNPEDTAATSEKLKGVDVIVSTVGVSGFEAQAALLEAAKAAGVRRFVPSEFGIDLDVIPEGHHPLFDGKKKLRRDLLASELEYTFILTGYFTERTYDPWFDIYISNSRAIIRGDGSSKASLTSIADIATWLPDILLDPSSKNAAVQLSGETLSFDDGIRIIEEVTGKQVDVTCRSAEDVQQKIDHLDSAWETVLETLALVISEGKALLPGPYWNIKAGKQGRTLRQHVTDTVAAAK